MGKVTVENDHDHDVAIYTLAGEIVYEEIRDAIAQYYAGTLTHYTIWDFSDAVINTRFPAEEIKKLGEQVRQLGAARPTGIDYVVVHNLLQYGLARMYYAYSEMTRSSSGPSLKTIVVRSKDDALAKIHYDAIVNVVPDTDKKAQ